MFAKKFTRICDTSRQLAPNAELPSAQFVMRVEHSDISVTTTVGPGMSAAQIADHCVALEYETGIFFVQVAVLPVRPVESNSKLPEKLVLPCNTTFRSADPDSFSPQHGSIQ